VVTSVFLVNLVKFNIKIFFGLVCVTRSLICEVLVLGTESFLCCFTSTTIFFCSLSDLFGSCCLDLLACLRFRCCPM
jgi:hypothetical protein